MAEFALLENSGLPVYLDKTNNLLAFEAPLLYAKFGRKVIREMTELLRDPDGIDMTAPQYDVYRNIHFAEDAELLKRNTYCYDITAIMSGQVNGECRKTSGHYHAFNQTRTNSHAEVYEVLKGSAIFILQKAKNFEDDPDKLEIEDLVIARVEEGQTIIIPPNYGHCSINAGEGPMFFSNLAYAGSYNHYNPVTHYKGMGYYVLRENGVLRFEKNERYGSNLPAPKFAVVTENPRFGIEFGKPVYYSYKENPEAFHFLGNPDGYEDEIFGMLRLVDSIA